jgi:hypothetical protein
MRSQNIRRSNPSVCMTNASHIRHARLLSRCCCHAGDPTCTKLETHVCAKMEKVLGNDWGRVQSCYTMQSAMRAPPIGSTRYSRTHSPHKRKAEGGSLSARASRHRSVRPRVRRRNVAPLATAAVRKMLQRERRVEVAWPYKSDPSCICKWIGVLQDVEKKKAMLCHLGPLHG